MLGEFNAHAQLDVVEKGIEARLFTFARFGQDLEHGVEPGGVDPSNQKVVTQRFQLVEQPLPAPNHPTPAFEWIAHRLQCEESLDAGNAGGHGGCGRSAGARRAADDELAPGGATRAAAACHSRYARIAVDPHQTHPRYPRSAKSAAAG